MVAFMNSIQYCGVLLFLSPVELFVIKNAHILFIDSKVKYYIELYPNAL